jgi:hypothetical protein
MGKVEKPALESDFDQYPEKPGDFFCLSRISGSPAITPE